MFFVFSQREHVCSTIVLPWPCSHPDAVIRKIFHYYLNGKDDNISLLSYGLSRLWKFAKSGVPVVIWGCVSLGPVLLIEFSVLELIVFSCYFVYIYMMTSYRQSIFARLSIFVVISRCNWAEMERNKFRVGDIISQNLEHVKWEARIYLIKSLSTTT